jgi:hypothetical protein
VAGSPLLCRAITQPTDVDYYVFAGKEGQRLLIHCLGASIDSKLTPEIKVLDKANRAIAAPRAAPLSDGLVDATLAEDAYSGIRLVQVRPPDWRGRPLLPAEH